MDQPYNPYTPPKSEITVRSDRPPVWMIPINLIKLPVVFANDIVQALSSDALLRDGSRPTAMYKLINCFMQLFPMGILSAVGCWAALASGKVFLQLAAGLPQDLEQLSLSLNLLALPGFILWLLIVLMTSMWTTAELRITLHFFQMARAMMVKKRKS